MGCKFGDAKGMPLLVAVRSGARDSMPGMMDTILNLGLNDETVSRPRRRHQQRALRLGLLPPLHPDVRRRRARRAEARRRGPRAVRDRHRGFKHEKYHKDIEDSDLTADDQQELVKRFKALVKERTGKGFPNDPWDQLRGAAGAVFGSWMNDRAIVYRRKYNIPAEWGTAVNVQAMVFGNTGDDLRFRRGLHPQPANGVNEFYGEFLINAQGEDVVAGVRTPSPSQAQEADAEVLRRADEGPRHPREALQGRAGRRVHHPGRQAVHAPDPQRQAHRRRRAQVLHGHGEGEAHRLGDRDPAQPGRPARPAPRPDLRPRRGQEGQGHRHRPARRPRRRLRQDLPQRRPRRRRRRQGREGPARPRRNLPRRPARHDRRRGHPHRPRRRLLARRARRPPDGQGLRLRRRRLEIDYDKKTVTVAGQTFKEGDFLSIDGTRHRLRRPDQDRPVRDHHRPRHGDKAAQKTEKFKTSSSS
jgi:pyruvate, orthophosphate dikinase